MKIVQLCPYDMQRPGGVQRHVADLSDWLGSQGHETRIVAPPAPGSNPQSRDRITEIGRSRALAIHGTAFELSFCNPMRARALARELRDWGADLVHIHTPWTPMLVGQVWRALNLPTVTTIHATLPRIDDPSLVDRYIRRAAGYFLRHSQTVITPSEAPLELLRSLVPDINATVLPPCVDLSTWRSARRHQPPNQKVHLVFLGRLEARKGVDVLLKAWRMLAPRLPDLTLTIAGEGVLRDDVLAATQADVSGRLHYVGRPDDTTARGLIGSADLFIAPALYGESFGIVLIEAMAAGAVPIAAANPGYSSVMTGLGADLLVPAGDATALAKMVDELALSAGKRDAYRVWATDHADRFDVQAVGPKYLDLYRRTIT